MIISPHINVYLKTTETCNLNCKHCFTSGSNGAKIFFNPDKVIDFFSRLRKECGWVRSARFMFHGGEPMLAPIESLYKAYHGLKDIFPEVRFGMQTNLVYKLTDEKRQFMKDVLFDDGFGTSWDYDIRFGSTAPNDAVKVRIADAQRKLWEENVKKLTFEDGHYLTMIVCITKQLIENMEPIEVMNKAISLGFKHILFERITSDGNAKINSDIIPNNRQQDEWLHKMFNQCIEHKTYEKIGNMLMSEIAEAFVYKNHTANRCRSCEQSLLTMNATGTIAGCPNTAPSEFWGHIDWSIQDNLASKRRLKAIACERFDRNPLCYECPAFQYCNSDCQQLAWDEDNTYCAAPKKVWKQMIKDNDTETYKKLIIGTKTGGPHGV